MSKYYIKTENIEYISHKLQNYSNSLEEVRGLPFTIQTQLQMHLQFGYNLSDIKNRLRIASNEITGLYRAIDSLYCCLQYVISESVEVDRYVNCVLTNIPYTTLEDIPDNEITETKNINITEWKPLEAITEAMIGNVGDPSTNRLDASIDALGFINSFLGNLLTVTNLRVTKAVDSRITIEYGSAIELNYSGKHTSLSQIIIDKYYNYSPSILFEADKREDEMIRSAFNLSGNGKYSMQLEFARVNAGDCGYKLIFEDGVLYQVPIIHEGTKFNIYYTENGETKLLFDAADILRNTRIKVPQDEAEMILQQLRDNGVI